MIFIGQKSYCPDIIRQKVENKFLEVKDVRSNHESLQRRDTNEWLTMDGFNFGQSHLEHCLKCKIKYCVASVTTALNGTLISRLAVITSLPLPAIFLSSLLVSIRIQLSFVCNLYASFDIYLYLLFVFSMMIVFCSAS